MTKLEKIEKIWLYPDSLTEKGESEILSKLDKIDTSSTLIVYINCIGGDIDSGFAIIDAIKFFSKKSIGVVIGRCHSMAIDILLSLDRRFCTTNSSFMIHETSLSFGEGYELTSKLSEDIKMQKKIEEERIKNVIKKTLIDRETIKEYFEKKQDMWFSSGEAVQWGLVEGIVKTDKELYSKLKIPTQKI